MELYLAYQVIARKWRPQSFHELVGQEHISTTLLNALRNNRLPQALLFTGVRGTGKTSTARILAKSLRCPNAVDFVPCGVCPSCEDIASSRSLDVIEIDGASNNGVDAVRELRETIGYMPSSGKYKVYIIDEVHMLSTSAFNALLKTLEEPPPHVVFIMATTEAQKIPNTILSRCQRFDFRRIPSRQIAAQLEKICLADGIKTEPQALWMIARQGDGSMRDSQSLLDQVITFSRSDVTAAKVIDVLGLTDRTILLEALTALVHRNPQAAVDLIEKVFRAGYDPKVFAQDLLEEIRHALMVRLCPNEPSRLVDLPDNEIEELRKLTADLGDEDLHALFDMALKGVNDLLRSQEPRIVLEMLLLRMAAAPRIANLAALFATAVAGGVASGAKTGAGARAASLGTQSPRPQPTVPLVPPPETKSATQPASQPAAETSAQAQTPPQTATQTLDTPAAPVEKPSYSMSSFTRPAAGRTVTTSGSNTVQPAAGASAQAPVTATAAPAAETRSPKSNDPWYLFVEQVKKSNSLLGAMLENTHLISNENSVLKIGVQKKMSFLFDKINDPENVKRIEAFVETLWNKTYKVQVQLADEKVKAATPKATADQAEMDHTKSIEQAVELNPLVQTAQNVFKTQIKSIKDQGQQTNVKSAKPELK
jgi:DNA polymerase-3 subunit gamma/tau